MGQDAIRKDGSNEGGNEQQVEQQEPVLSDRELMLQQIDEQLANAPKMLIAGQEPAKEQDKDQQLSAGADTDDAGEKKPLMVKVKVDGVEQEMPIDDVVKGYQKDAAASKRLQQAAEKERELEQQRAELEQLRAQIQSSQVNNQPSGQGSDADDIDQQIEDAMSAIAVGDDEKATELMKVLIKGRGKATATQQIDIDALKQSVKQELELERAASERELTFKSFLDDNPEFADATSPQRKYGDYLFQTRLAAQIESGEISYQEALDEAAAEAKRIYGSAEPGQGATGKTESTTKSKQERKQAIDNVPIAGGRAAKAAQTPETVDDAITEMRKMRGQVI